MTRRAILYACLGVLLTLSAAIQIHHATDAIAGLRPTDKRVRWPLQRERYSQRIVSLRPEAESSGLRGGDVLHSVNGRPSSGRSALQQALAAARPGDLLELIVRRHGVEDVTSERVTIRLRAPETGDVYRVCDGQAPFGPGPDAIEC